MPGGRKIQGNTKLTHAERQRRYREKKKLNHTVKIYLELLKNMQYFGPNS